MMATPQPEVDAGDMEMIDTYLEHLRRAGYAATTIEARRRILTRLNELTTYGVGQVTSEELAAWLYRDELAPNTWATYYNCAKSFYAWATSPDDPWLSFDPVAGLEPARTVPGIARPVTDEQLRRVLTESPEPIRTWAKFASYQGLRCIEISRLDREHITEQNLFVVKGKGGRPRVHDTHPDVWAAVRELPPGPIARMPNGQRATPFQISSIAALYFRRQLKMPGVSMHRLRHWLGVTLQRLYRDIRVTQAALGHISVQSTQIYTDATAEQQRAARAMLPRLAGE